MATPVTHITIGGDTRQIHDSRFNPSDFVKTVNGESPDENGNVNTPTGGSDSATSIQIVNRIYTGEDLAAYHATEIAAHGGNVWAWIRDRIRASNFNGINVGDWIAFNLTGAMSQRVEAVVAGINIYRRNLRDTPGTTNSRTPPHIEFVSRDCVDVRVPYNLVNYNNATLAGRTFPEIVNMRFRNTIPFYTSNIERWLTGTQGIVAGGTGLDGTPHTTVDYRASSSTPGLIHFIPTALRDVLSFKQLFYSARHFSDAVLTEDNNWAECINTTLWLPTETEIYGTAGLGTPGISMAAAIQYPLFVGNTMTRNKRHGHGGDVTQWWLANAASGLTTHCTAVSVGGVPTFAPASTPSGVPVCFRIM